MASSTEGSQSVAQVSSCRPHIVGARIRFVERDGGGEVEVVRSEVEVEVDERHLAIGSHVRRGDAKRK